MAKDSKPKITAPRWHDEAWAKRWVFNGRQAAYNVGRISNCFRFHAEQAFLFSLSGADADDIDHEREQAHTALLRLVDLASRLDHKGDSSPAENIRRLFSTKAVKWSDDLVDDACLEYAMGLKLCSEVDGVPLSTELLHKSMLNYAEDVQIDDDVALVCSWVDEESRILIRLGTELDLGVRPRDIYPYLFERSKPTQSTSNGNGDAKKKTGAKRAKGDAATDRHVRHRTRGEVLPDSQWNRRLQESLAAAQISLASAIVDSLDHLKTVQASVLVDQIDVVIWNRIDPHKPFWDASTRQLMFRGETIKSLRTQAKAKNGVPSQELILRHFQQLGWPESIETSALGINPAHQGIGPLVIKFVSGLNTVRAGATGCGSRRIPHMSFSTADGGARIRWEAKPVSSTPE